MPLPGQVEHLDVWHFPAYWGRWAAGMCWCVDYVADPTPLLQLLAETGSQPPRWTVTRGQVQQPVVMPYLLCRAAGIGTVVACGGTQGTIDLLRQIGDTQLVNRQVNNSSWTTTAVWDSVSQSLLSNVSTWWSANFPDYQVGAEETCWVGYSLGGVASILASTAYGWATPPRPLPTVITLAAPPAWIPQGQTRAQGEQWWVDGDIVPSLYPHINLDLSPVVILGGFGPRFGATAFRHGCRTMLQASHGIGLAGSPPGISGAQILSIIRGEASPGADHSLLMYRDALRVDDTGWPVSAEIVDELMLSRVLRRIYGNVYVDKMTSAPLPDMWEVGEPAVLPAPVPEYALIGDLFSQIVDP
jgi:hypothetical protein